MTKSKSRLSLATVGAVLALLHMAPAEAQNTRSFVASFGNDANTCADPDHACATFDGAFVKTLTGGDITVVNSGEYGFISIPRSINITNDGAGEASISNAPGANLVISAGVGDVVSLRGLVIDGRGSAQAGILVTQAGAVHVQKCVIRNFEAPTAGYGILVGFIPPMGSPQVFVSDTIIFNNGSSAGTGGIVVQPVGTASPRVVLDRVHLENNVIGLLIDGTQSTGNGAHVIVRDSVVSGNASHGIEALSAPGKASAFLVVEHTTSVNNAGTGIIANGPRATMLLNDNTVARNGTGISAINSGQLISYGNNKVNNNLGADGVPTGSYSPI